MSRPFAAFSDCFIPVTECGCWIWMRGVSGDGYGAFRGMRAHRYSWQMHFGEVPPEMHVLHRCDVPLCVNPDHLFLGTHTDNMRDKVAKGRANYPLKLPQNRRKWREPKVYEVHESVLHPRHISPPRPQHDTRQRWRRPRICEVAA